MGKVLQIRVMAQTVSPSDVGWNWHRLCKLAFGKVPTDESKKAGVLELISALEDNFRFGDWPKDLKEKLQPGLEKVINIRHDLESALADWNPGKANSLSNDLEDALDSLEDACPDNINQKN